MKTSLNHRSISSPKVWILSGFCFLSWNTAALAQNTIYYGQGFFGFGPAQIKNVQPAFGEVGRNILAVNKLATEMKWRYGWELQKNPDSAVNQELFTQMKGFCGSSEALIQTYQENDRPGFVAAASQLQLSFASIETLQGKVRLPAAVTALIRQSKPMVAMIASQAETCPLGR